MLTNLPLAVGVKTRVERVWVSEYLVSISAQTFWRNASNPIVLIDYVLSLLQIEL